MSSFSEIDRQHMARAIELAALGEGHVEPNPMVGCVIAAGSKVIGEGWHKKFGGPHAEVNALTQAENAAKGATLYVSLEPCCHKGKTPPCTAAILQSGVSRVVVATPDPFPAVDGGGIAELQANGVNCEIGLLETEALSLLAPYRKLIGTGRPWIIAKWAMTLDGKIATCTGSSQWISNEQSREITHRLRGRVDAVLVGSGTALSDDPMLTARPANPQHVLRSATRIVLDSKCSISPTGNLVQSIPTAPLLIATSTDAPLEACDALSGAGAEVLICSGETSADRLDFLLAELGRRQMTNILVEGGSGLFGQLLDSQAIDEVHAFIAPKLVGGSSAPSPISGAGVELIDLAMQLQDIHSQQLDDDTYIRGRNSRSTV